MTKTPEQWLADVTPGKKGGTLKLILGYAPGVGKTYNMLSEAIRRNSRGEDVVIGVVETHGRKGVMELAAKLEAVPRKKIEYKGTVFEEMDLDGILARKPAIVVIDELAHSNIEGSRHAKRYEDVLELLDADIDVMTTMNVQHLESVAPSVRRISGITVRETVPDWLMNRVREVVMADLTPEALQTRMRRGDIYPIDRTEKALANFFRPGNLIALRELALQEVAQEVDRSLETYLDQEGGERKLGIRERFAVAISSNPAAQQLIGRAARMAKRLDGELYVVYVDIGTDDNETNQRTLAANIRFAEAVGARVTKLESATVAHAVADFVRDKHITQVVFGHSAVKGWKRFLYLNAIHKFLRDAPPVDVHIVTQQSR
jgi:two-component system, OmpR family, sensor histidine kinase KdpD